MNNNALKELIDSGREIEFIYNNKKYSITYGEINGVEVISFCEYYKESTEVTSFEELLKITRDGISVEKMINSISEDDIYIF